MTVLDAAQLDAITGGGGQGFENMRDQNGYIISGAGAYYEYLSEATKPVSVRLRERMDRVNVPWKLFNGIFAGLSATSPLRRPTPQPY